MYAEGGWVLLLPCPAPPPWSTTPASLASPHSHVCAIMKSSSVSPQQQLVPECTATEPPPAALQPRAALTTGTHRSPTRERGGPNALSISLGIPLTTRKLDICREYKSGTRLGVAVSLHPAYKNLACS